LVAFAAIVTICVIYFFVRLTGLAIHNIMAEEKWSWRSLLHFPAWVGLFMVSAYGFLAACLLLLDGPDICRNEVTSANESFGKLAAVAHEYLPHKAYQTKLNRMQSDKAAFLGEIVSAGGGNFCGIGEKADRFFRRLQNDLPGLEYISGTHDEGAVASSAPPLVRVASAGAARNGRHGATARQTAARAPAPARNAFNHNCDSNRPFFANMQRDYDRLISDRIAHDPDIVKHQIVDRTTLINDIDEAATNNRGELSKLQQSLSGLQSFLLNLPLYHGAARGLEKVALDYAPLRIRLATMAPAHAESAPGAIHATACERIASPMGVVENFLSRANHLRTWLYAIVAIFADLTAAYFAACVFQQSAALKSRDLRFARASRVDGSDVEYIWAPEPHPDRKGLEIVHVARETEVRQ